MDVEHRLNEQECRRQLQLVAQGDRLAYAQLYDTVAPVVYGITCHIVGVTAEAEELTARVMHELWTSAAVLTASKHSVVSSVATLAHRRAVEHRRGMHSTGRALRRRKQASSVQCSGAGLVIGEACPVAAALEGLTPPQRRAIELSYYDGCTYRQIAALLGISPGMVTTHLREGLTRLAALWALSVQPVDVDHRPPAAGPPRKGHRTRGSR